MEKPKSIVIATNLLWFTLAICITAILPSAAHSRHPVFSYFIGAATLVTLGFFYFKISTGKNWARMTFAVTFILGLPLFFLYFLLPIPHDLSSVDITITIVQMAIQGYALFLLFTKPGSTWFQKRVIENK